MQQIQGRGNVPEATIVNTDVPLPTVDVVINGTKTRINATDYTDDMELAEGQVAPASSSASAPAAAGIQVPPLPGATEPGNTIPVATPPATPAATDATDVVPLADRAIAKHGKQFFVVDKNGKKLDVNGKLDEAAGGFDTEDAARATLTPPAL